MGKYSGIIFFICVLPITFQLKSSDRRKDILTPPHEYVIDDFYGDSDEYCDTTSELHLQIVIVFDRTLSFFNRRVDFSAALDMITQDAAFNAKYNIKAIEFGVVLFSDYYYDWEPEPLGNNTRTDKVAELKKANTAQLIMTEDDCYTFWQPLTANVAEAKMKLENFQELDGGDEDVESSLTAMLFAAVDKRMGWISGRVDADGRRVHKFLVLATDQASTEELGSPQSHIPPKLEQSDSFSCDMTLPPTQKMMESSLMQNYISVIGLYSNLNQTTAEKPLDFYSRTLGRMDLPYHAANIGVGNATIVTVIQDGIKFATQCVDPDPPSYNTLGF